MLPSLSLGFSNQAAATNDGIQSLGGGISYGNTAVAPSNSTATTTAGANSTVAASTSAAAPINQTTLLLGLAILAGCFIFMRRG